MNSQEFRIQDFGGRVSLGNLGFMDLGIKEVGIRVQIPWHAAVFVAAPELTLHVSYDRPFP